MSLREEIKSSTENLPIRANPLRSVIEKDVDSFLASGGKIELLDSGQKGLADGDFLFMPECEGAKQTMIPSKLLREKGQKGAQANKLRSPKPESTGHRNIQRLTNGKFQVYMLRAAHGNFDTLAEAIALRQQKRASLGYPFISESE